MNLPFVPDLKTAAVVARQVLKDGPAPRAVPAGFCRAASPPSIIAEPRTRMRVPFRTTSILRLALVVLLALLAGCSLFNRGAKKGDAMNTMSVEELYAQGATAIDNRNYDLATRIADALRAKVEPAFLPRRVVMLPALPRDAVGKISRGAIAVLVIVQVAEVPRPSVTLVAVADAPPVHTHDEAV